MIEAPPTGTFRAFMHLGGDGLNGKTEGFWFGSLSGKLFIKFLGILPIDIDSD
ncbi:hypothetical protein DIPPA_08012 [Diplonema papillatum]|nr:hypothetical protein DIPPA_08012 [Diplonema papillatum]